MSLNTHEIQPTHSDAMVPPAVAGWLLVLCLLLTFVYPASSLYAIWQAVPKLIAAHNHTRVLLLVVYSGLFAAVAVCSFWAGVKLWLVKPGAVGFTRRYLLGYLIANIAYFAFWMLVVRTTQMVSLAEMGWYHVVGPISSTALWYFYLEHSKRVRETYRRG